MYQTLWDMAKTMLKKKFIAKKVEKYELSVQLKKLERKQQNKSKVNIKKTDKKRRHK